MSAKVSHDAKQEQAHRPVIMDTAPKSRRLLASMCQCYMSHWYGGQCSREYTAAKWCAYLVSKAKQRGGGGEAAAHHCRQLSNG